MGKKRALNQDYFKVEGKMMRNDYDIPQTKRVTKAGRKHKKR